MRRRYLRGPHPRRAVAHWERFAVLLDWGTRTVSRARWSRPATCLHWILLGVLERFWVFLQDIVPLVLRLLIFGNGIRVLVRMPQPILRRHAASKVRRVPRAVLIVPVRNRVGVRRVGSYVRELAGDGCELAAMVNFERAA